MKKTSLLKKSLMSLAAVAMMMGVVAPAMADEGKNEVRIRVEKEGNGFVHGLGLGSLGLNSLSGLGFGGLGLHGLSGLGSFGGFGDNAVNAMRTVTENFSSIPSAISITKVPGGGTLGL